MPGGYYGEEGYGNGKKIFVGKQAMIERRNDFGIYRNHKNLRYLDYAATTFMPDSVMESWLDYQQRIAVGCYRGNGLLSDSAQEAYFRSKNQILTFFEAENTYDALFGKNATECLNLMAYGLKQRLRPGDIILMGPYEHHSNIIPWTVIAKETGACLVQFPILENGEINYSFVNTLDQKRIKVFSISAISNVNAYMIDFEWFHQFISNRNVISILDVSQAVGHRKLEFEKIGADAYIMSAHKMYGPKNIGAAIVKKDIIGLLEPFLYGGGMVWNSLGASPKWQEGARRFEAGTFDVGLLKAWAEACRYLENIGMGRIMDSDREIFTYAKKRLINSGIHVVPGGEEYASLISFQVKNIHPHDIAAVASKNMFEIRTGHMCAQAALDNLGFTALCRLSWGIGSDKEDVNAFVRLIEEELK